MAKMQTLTINGKQYTIADPDAAHIDDSVVGTSAWSSNKITHEIERKVNGVAIECNSEGHVIELLDASNNNIHGLHLYGKTTQSGTPSASSPISLTTKGRTNKNIDVTMSSGKNIFGGEALADWLVKVAKATKDTENKTVKFTASNVSAKVIFRSFKPNTQYTFIFYGRNSRSDSTTTNLGFRYVGASSNTIIAFSSTNENSYCLYTTTAGRSVDYIIGRNSSNTTTLYYEKCGIFEGALTVDDFEPYVGNTATFLTQNGLPAVPVSSGGNYTDANGQQWICDEIDVAKGKYIHRIGGGKLTDIDTWDVSSSFGGYLLFSSACPSTWYRNDASYEYNRTTGLFTHGAYAEYWDSATDRAFMSGGKVYVGVPSSVASDATAFKAWITEQDSAGNTPEIMVILDSDRVVETDLSIEELDTYSALHTYKPNTNVFNDCNAHMELDYEADTKTYIDNKFNELAAALINNT